MSKTDRFSKPIKKDISSLSDFVESVKEEFRTVYKPTSYIKPSVGFMKATNLNGYPTSAFHVIFGKPNTGKTTLIIELAKDCIEKGIIPVIINLEDKFNWDRAKAMGFPVTKVVTVNEDGERVISYKGDFIYIDKMSLRKKNNIDTNIGVTSEDVFNAMIELIQKQQTFAKKNTYFSFAFFLDSLPKLSPKSYREGYIGSDGFFKASDDTKSNNMQKVQFVNNALEAFVDNYISPTQSADYPYTNTFFGISQVMDATVMGVVTSKKLGGNKLRYLATTITNIGGKAGEGGQQIYKTIKGEDYFIGTEVAVEIEKLHSSNNDSDDDKFEVISTTKSKVINTAIGYIDSSKDSIEQYKKSNIHLFKGLSMDEETLKEFLSGEHSKKEVSFKDEE